MIISSPGTGVVQVDDTLHIRQAVSVTSQPAEVNKLNMQTETYGQTGDFLGKAQGTREELIRKNRRR